MVLCRVFAYAWRLAFLVFLWVSGGISCCALVRLIFVYFFQKNINFFFRAKKNLHGRSETANQTNELISTHTSMHLLSLGL